MPQYLDKELTVPVIKAISQKIDLTPFLSNSEVDAQKRTVLMAACGVEDN